MITNEAQKNDKTIIPFNDWKIRETSLRINGRWVTVLKVFPMVNYQLKVYVISGNLSDQNGSTITCGTSDLSDTLAEWWDETKTRMRFEDNPTEFDYNFFNAQEMQDKVAEARQ